jgi:predicted dehydrogenase
MIRTLVVGLGQMGQSHALAYQMNPAFEMVGLVNRSRISLSGELAHIPVELDFHAALARLKPDLVSIATYSDSHATLSIAALEAGAHVFVEKPLATTVEDARLVAATAERMGRKLLIGHILRHHPTWNALIAKARDLGGPFVFRMNLNQRSSGAAWEIHKNLMKTTSPIVDCGVHYVDVMCQITDADPVSVHAMGVRLSDEIAPDMYNYGQFQVLFSDGSCGWYEAGWGPMMSETAHFVKDVTTPNGAVSLRAPQGIGSADIEGHSAADVLITAPLVGPTTEESFPDHVGHQGLCDRQAAYLARAITENLDLSRHVRDVVQSLEICLAADASVRSGRSIKF